MNKLPLISYLVKTQIVEKSAGFKYLHTKAFTSDNILEARRKAYEYYEAAIDVLQRDSEILKDENGKIHYKNPQNYEDGIKMFIRINHDFFRDGITDKQNTQYQIEAHYHLNSEQKRKLNFGKKMHQRYWDILDIVEQKPPTKEKLDYYSRHFRNMAERKRLQELNDEKIAFIKFRDKDYADKLLQTACAFLNTEGGTIILGQTREMKQKNSARNLKDDLMIAEKLLQSVFSECNANFKVTKEYLSGIGFVKILVSKSEKETYYQNEFFVRTKYGNVVDFEKTYGDFKDK